MSRQVTVSDDYTDPEKHFGDVEHNEVGITASKSSNHSDEEYLNAFTPEEQRKIIHRVDRRLVTTVGVMYCISLMDRTNLSAAAIAGYSLRISLHSTTLC